MSDYSFEITIPNENVIMAANRLIENFSNKLRLTKKDVKFFEKQFRVIYGKNCHVYYHYKIGMVISITVFSENKISEDNIVFMLGMANYLRYDVFHGANTKFDIVIT